MLHMLIVLCIITLSHENQCLAIRSPVGCITLRMVAPALLNSEYIALYFLVTNKVSSPRVRMYRVRWRVGDIVGLISEPGLLVHMNCVEK